MRPGLVASVIAAATVLVAAPALASGARHHHGQSYGQSHGYAHRHAGTQAHHRKAVAQHHHARHHAWRHARHAGRPSASRFGGAWPAGPYAGGYWSGAASAGGVSYVQPATQTINVNINTIPTMAGIRRPPEAAPLLFIIPNDRREARAAERAGAAIRSLGSADTTTARIIVVR